VHNRQGFNFEGTTLTSKYVSLIKSIFGGKVRKESVSIEALAQIEWALADAARDKENWAEAAEGYRRGLRIDSKAAFIWIQLGHALKEQRALDKAFVAYWTGLELAPAMSDTYLQIGHCLKVMDRLSDAVKFYLRAITLDPNERGARKELVSLGWSPDEISKGARATSEESLLDIRPTQIQRQNLTVWLEAGDEPRHDPSNTEKSFDGAINELKLRVEDAGQTINNLADQISRCLGHLSSYRAHALELAQQRDSLHDLGVELRREMAQLTIQSVARDLFQERLIDVDETIKHLGSQIVRCLEHLSSLRSQALELSALRAAVESLSWEVGLSRAELVDLRAGMSAQFQSTGIAADARFASMSDVLTDLTKVVAGCASSTDLDHLSGIVNLELAERPTQRQVEEALAQALANVVSDRADTADLADLRSSVDRNFSERPTRDEVAKVVETATAKLTKESSLEGIREEIRGLATKSMVSLAIAAAVDPIQTAFAGNQRFTALAEKVPLLEKALAEFDKKISTVTTRLGIDTPRALIGDQIAPMQALIAEQALVSKTLQDVVHRVMDETAALRDQSNSRDTQVDNMLRYLDGRLEFVRREILYEFHHGARLGSEFAAGTNLEPRIVSPDRVAAAKKSGLRLNLGSGHKPRDGYINIDRRELPQIDIVCEADAVPLEPESAAEISSSHLVEHFPLEEFKRRVLPHWFQLLKDGGRLHAIAPDGEAMIAEHAKGNYPFASFREVFFGAQDYIGDFHYNMFTPSSLAEVLLEAGFVDVIILDRGRRNGKCYEFELEATKPKKHSHPNRQSLVQG
jgi:tetratricopeptide (TPR) repeat protein